ncbi:MAG: hypothetical protein E4H36_00660 [Spirochaetales bacterium]|nr:MAG: hypothetical protein E4H36_00660 [Spirochaetales bacterium]
MRKKIRTPSPWLISLTTRLGLGVWVVFLQFIILFFIGSRQRFTESTQLFLLTGIKYLSLALCILMIYSFIVQIYDSVASRRARILRYFIFIAGFAAGGAVYALTVFMGDWLSP